MYKMEGYERHIRVLKLNYYNSGNWAGKLLAKRLATQSPKAKMYFLYHSVDNHKIGNPQDIADPFVSYYSSL